MVERDAGADQFLVLACDGVWDVMSNAEVGAYVLEQSAGGIDNLGSLAEALIDEGLARNSRDNMSAVIVAFKAAPRPTADAVAAYKVRAAKAAAEAAAAAGDSREDSDE